MNATWRQVLAPSATVLSYDMPVSSRSPSRGLAFHSLHATSQALQPMQMEVSVKNPLRASCVCHLASVVGSVGPDSCPIYSSAFPVMCWLSVSVVTPARS